FEDDVVTLRNLCFISVEKGNRNFEIHGLVQLATRKWLDTNNQLRKWRKEFVMLMAREFPSGSFANWTRCQVLLPHVAPMFEKEPTEDELLQDWAQVLHNAGWYLWMKGQYIWAESVARKAVKTRERIVGQDTASTLNSVSILALVLQGQGNYEAAEAMNRRALEGREKALGKEHPDTLASVYCLAYLLHHRHRYEEAMLLYKRASSGYTTTLGLDHPTTQA
ncbi:hypothetical protein DM02DRAFT_475174, partial [Periconia macrospinosa]